MIICCNICGYEIEKEKAKMEKQKAKLEKEKKLQEEKEKQEKLLEQMKKTKKEKKEKPKKEKKEKVEKIETKPTSLTPAPELTTTPTLFQTLSQKTEDTEKTSVSNFMPFIAKQEPETQEASKLRIIPNVSDIESKPASFAPTQPPQTFQAEIPKTSGKEVVTCKQCGAVLSSDYQFCNKCGTQL